MITLQINTTQNVNITLNAASLGDRILAFLLDFLLIISYLGGVYYLVGKSGLLDWDDQWSLIAINSLIMLPAMFYTLVSEFFMDGQTLGKKVLKIKVIKLDGYQATFFDFITRWLFRLVDIFLGMGTGGIAILSIALSKNAQRLGDMAAGTAVISLKEKFNISHTILEEAEEQYQPKFPSVINLTDRDMQIIKDMFLSSQKNRDNATIIKLRTKIEEITKTTKGTYTDFEYITYIMKDYSYFTQNM